MAELATFLDAHNAGFEVYPRSWHGLVNIGGAQAYPNHLTPPNGWNSGSGGYSDDYQMNEFIPKNAFIENAGEIYNEVGYHTYPGIKPVPTTLGGYADNEFIEKSALVISYRFYINWSIIDTSGILSETNVYMFTGDSNVDLINYSTYPTIPFMQGLITYNLPMQVYNTNTSRYQDVTVGDTIKVYYEDTAFSGSRYELFFKDSFTIQNEMTRNIDIVLRGSDRRLT